jgi:[methyl-Co(III) methanol-specific corrinoid protein]:coenzyme M methyltransferase
MEETMNARQRVLGLLTRRPVDGPACFSGMGNVTTAGLERLECSFPSVHADAVKMADLAATSFELFGYESAVVPFDLCVEAEALGCAINTYQDVPQLLYPTIRAKAIPRTEDMADFQVAADFLERGRLPVVREALRRLRQGYGDRLAVGSYMLGPFTLAGQLVELDQLFLLSLSDRRLVEELLHKLTAAVIAVGLSYREAGADFLTVREMGAATDILSPRAFQSLIQPCLREVAASLPPPRVLHICGSTDKIVALMAECGFDAISVEPKNNVRASRELVPPETLIFGNLDAFKLLVHGTPAQVTQAVEEALEAGVDAVWPSCDIWPEAKVENLDAMVAATRQRGAELWWRNHGS